MIRRLSISRLKRDERGAALVEFALVLPVLAMLLMATFDIGYQVYMRSVVAGAVEKAARKAAVGSMTTGQVDTYLRNQILRIIPKSERNNASAVQITKLSYSNFSRVNKPERLTTDLGTVGTYDAATDCYEDGNRNGVYDVSGGASGVGSAEDVLYYTVTVSFPRQFPGHKLLGLSSTQSATVKTIVRNQPFAEQAASPVRCP